MIYQYWHDGAPPADVSRCLQTIRQANPDDRVDVYDRSRAMAIMQGVSDRVAKAFASCSVPAMQADLFRYGVLWLSGGVYVDADSIGIGPMTSLSTSPDGDVLLFRRANGRVMNGVIATRVRGHDLLATTLELAVSNVEARVDDVWLATGPGLFTYLALWLRLEDEGDFRAAMMDELGWLPMSIAGPYIDRVIAMGANVGVKSLFRGVEIRPESSLNPTLRLVGPLEYKRGPQHWLNWVGSIYG